MHNTRVIASKEFRTFFQTPIGYVILFVFTAIAGWWVFSLGQFFVNKEANLRGLFQGLPWLFLVFAPAITMRLWAEERKSGTAEVLMTMPVKDWEMVLGKFLATAGVIAAWLLCLLPILFVVKWLGDPDMGPIWGGFLGAWLLGCAFASIGLASSAATENQIIALVLGVAGCFFFMLVGFQPVVAMFPEAFGAFLHNLSLQTHFSSIGRGVIDTRDLLYYVCFIGFFLYLNKVLVRRHSGGGLSVVLVAGILVLANNVGGSVFYRLDLTEDQRFTLSDDTKRVLARLDDDLRLTAYLSSDLPPAFTNVRRDIEDLIAEFESFGGGALRLEVVDPSTSEDGKNAAVAANIPEVPVQQADTTSVEAKLVQLGIVLEYRDKTESIRFVESIENLEYDLVLRIDQITRPKVVKVAFQASDPFPNMNMPGMQQPRDRHGPQQDMRVLNELIKEQFETTTVSLNEKVEDEIATIILANGERLTDQQKYHLDQFVMRGGGLIVLAEGNTPANMGRGGPGPSPFFRGPLEMASADILSHYGVTINQDVVMDKNCAPIQVPTGESIGPIPLSRPVEYPPLPIALEENINQEHPISAGTRQLLFMFPSSLTLNPKPRVDAIELVETSNMASRLDGQFMMLQYDSLADPETFDQQFVLAALLQGEFESFYQAREIPAEVVASVTEEAPPEGMDLGGVPDGFGLEGLAAGDEDTVLAKERDEPADSAEPATEEDSDGPPATEDPVAEPDSGGEDIPGGGLRLQDAAPAPPVEAEAQEPAAMDDGLAREELGYLGKSPPGTRILVVGSVEFVTDQAYQSRLEQNFNFLLNAVNFLSTNEDLSGLRRRRGDARRFEEPESNTVLTAQFLGMGAMPLLLVVLGVWVNLWRKVFRPARARRAMAMASQGSQS